MRFPLSSAQTAQIGIGALFLVLPWVFPDLPFATKVVLLAIPTISLAYALWAWTSRTERAERREAKARLATDSAPKRVLQIEFENEMVYAHKKSDLKRTLYIAVRGPDGKQPLGATVTDYFIAVGNVSETKTVQNATAVLITSERAGVTYNRPLLERDTHATKVSLRPGETRFFCIARFIDLARSQPPDRILPLNQDAFEKTIKPWLDREVLLIPQSQSKEFGDELVFLNSTRKISIAVFGDDVPSDSADFRVNHQFKCVLMEPKDGSPLDFPLTDELMAIRQPPLRTARNTQR